ncbi:UNVERIFIED_CONTAM: hypothetical protein GTU68_056355 [Idotea baltica]|nr:hypothetical protein [Idotea baltica]
MLKKLFKLCSSTKTKDTLPSHKTLHSQDYELDHSQLSSNAISIVKRLQEANFQAYLVGGCVRDIILQIKPKDFDVATNATPEQVRGLFRNARTIGRRFKLVHIFFGREIIEVATFRSHHNTSGSNDKEFSNSKGRILDDNVYGTLSDDAQRRDFSINSLYYDPIHKLLIDESNGLKDIKKKTIRLIGEPCQRYKEDPVRMLRAIRFAAKLDFNIEHKSLEPIHNLSPLLEGIPASRLFDETLKLLLSGQAVKTYDLLVQHNILNQLLPTVNFDDNKTKLLINNTLVNTDDRIHQGKHITPAFLFAALLWPNLIKTRNKLQNSGMTPIQATQVAARETINAQCRRTSIPKRFSIPMQEIWILQERLTRRRGKRADILLANPRFRAAYDFLLLRESTGEQTKNLGNWWTLYQEANDSERRNMVSSLSFSSPKAKRNHRSRHKKKITTTDNISS